MEPQQPQGLSDTGKIALDAQNTLVPVGLVAGVVVAVLGGAIWLNNSLQIINSRLSVIEAAIITKVDNPELESWALRFQLLNPHLAVPDPATGKALDTVKPQ